MTTGNTLLHGVPHRPGSWNPLATIAMLVLRAYVGVVWIRFGVAKLRDGWLLENPPRFSREGECGRLHSLRAPST